MGVEPRRAWRRDIPRSTCRQAACPEMTCLCQIGSMSEPPPIKPAYIALACILAVAAMFVGSIVISVAAVQAERAAPAAPSGDS